MTIFGALVSIVGSLGYAAYDEARAWYRASGYHDLKEKETDSHLYYDLKAMFDDNWDYDGASLYPPKLIPFLALHEKIRMLWVNSIIRQVMNVNNKTAGSLSNNPYPRMSTTPYGCGASRYNGKEQAVDCEKTIYGPSYYEYDFVKETYPDDWEIYMKSTEDHQEKEIVHVRTKSIQNHVLIALSVVMVITVLIVFGKFAELFVGWDPLVFRIVCSVSTIIAFLPGFIVLYRSNIKPPKAFAIIVILIAIIIAFPNICG